MKRYLRILEPTVVYSKHELSAKTPETLKPGELISYNREKRRNGINWMEIYINGYKVAYIQKEARNFFICKHAILSDENASGFTYSFKTELKLPRHMLFLPEGHLDNTKHTIGQISMKSIEKASENKMIYITLEYPAELIDVEPVIFRKNEHFFVTENSYGSNEIFMEVDNMKGKKGFLLKKTNYTNLEDIWVTPVAIGVAILTVIGIFVAFLESGWIVISGLMVIVGVIVGFVMIIVLQILLMILRGIFNQIRKRF